MVLQEVADSVGFREIPSDNGQLLPSLPPSLPSLLLPLPSLLPSVFPTFLTQGRGDETDVG